MWISCMIKLILTWHPTSYSVPVWWRMFFQFFKIKFRNNQYQIGLNYLLIECTFHWSPLFNLNYEILLTSSNLTSSTVVFPSRNIKFDPVKNLPNSPIPWFWQMTTYPTTYNYNTSYQTNKRGWVFKLSLGLFCSTIHNFGPILFKLRI